MLMFLKLSEHDASLYGKTNSLHKKEKERAAIADIYKNSKQS